MQLMHVLTLQDSERNVDGQLGHIVRLDNRILGAQVCGQVYGEYLFRFEEKYNNDVKRKK